MAARQVNRNPDEGQLLQKGRQVSSEFPVACKGLEPAPAPASLRLQIGSELSC